MTVEEAVGLIATPEIALGRTQTWCDLGCGEGLFTRALASLLLPGSAIYAIDKSRAALERVPAHFDGVTIHRQVGDLNREGLRLPIVDGVLMANVLHFISEQEALLKLLRTVSARLVIVEYERSQRSRWQPYPVPFARLCELLRGAGFGNVVKIGTRQSRFGGLLYSALADAQVRHT